MKVFTFTVKLSGDALEGMTEQEATLYLAGALGDGTSGDNVEFEIISQGIDNTQNM